MNVVISTEYAPAPASDYAQGVATPAGARWVHVSGQVGNALDGSLPEDVEAQHENAWNNVFAVLEADGMDRNDIVDVLGIVTSPEDVPVFRKMRDRMLAGHVACATLLVCALANPDWKVEIAVRAAKAS